MFREDSKAAFQVAEVNGERFLTNILLLHQVSQLGVIAEHLKGVLKSDCDGLMEAYLKSPMHKIGTWTFKAC